MAEQKMPNEYWTTAEVKGHLRDENVLAKPHSSEACQGKIIGAHTIPYSQLAKFASDGHVYAIGATLADLARSDGQFTMGVVGIGELVGQAERRAADLVAADERLLLGERVRSQNSTNIRMMRTA